MSTRPEELNVLAVCGLGMGTSLILRMTCETALDRLGLKATVSHTDLSSAVSQNPDVLVGQGMHVADLAGIGTIQIVVEDFVDDVALESQLRQALSDEGWL
ncbi:PTS sugar transporter subunit IIB [Demequina sediminicola]|uniref:PTS sugar transporter subunit IIB n=1 Tax=Demequina sediminicola TaxID=1095026 RepID=UPI000781DB71|nr:PTS sugar transporter subunit IIB [Demequina sediminicola]